VAEERSPILYPATRILLVLPVAGRNLSGPPRPSFDRWYGDQSDEDGAQDRNGDGGYREAPARIADAVALFLLLGGRPHLPFPCARVDLAL
jgi:hypothetical protein